MSHFASEAAEHSKAHQLWMVELLNSAISCEVTYEQMVQAGESNNCDTVGSMLKILKNRKVIDFPGQFLMYPMHKESIIKLLDGSSVLGGSPPPFSTNAPAPTPAPTTTPTPLPTTATATTPTPIATTPAAGTKASQLATLTDEVFAEKFAMSRIEFSALPKWKQQNALKKQNLF